MYLDSDDKIERVQYSKLGCRWIKPGPALLFLATRFRPIVGDLYSLLIDGSNNDTAVRRAAVARYSRSDMFCKSVDSLCALVNGGQCCSCCTIALYCIQLLICGVQWLTAMPISAVLLPQRFPYLALVVRF